MKTLMIYGAAGYTGRMATDHARAAGLDIVLAGRDEASLARLAAEIGLAYRVFPVNAGPAADEALSDVAVLLNCAGPFLRTAEPLMRACIRNGVHYLDIAAELDSYRLAEALDSEAAAAGVMLLPGSGGSVAMLGSLAARAIERAGAPAETLRIALHVAGSMSRGSAISASENMTAETLIRQGGKLVAHPTSETRLFDFGQGSVDCFPVTLPDLITIGRTHAVPNIETYVHVSGDAFPEGDLAALPDGPSFEQREANRYHAAVEVITRSGAVSRATLETVNGYSFTPMAAAEAARRVLEGEIRPGFQTPVGLFGSGFAETIANTRIDAI